MIAGVLESFTDALGVELAYPESAGAMRDEAARLESTAHRQRIEGDARYGSDQWALGPRDVERAARGWRFAADAREAIEAAL
jgi:hypothetical protein